MAFLIRTIDFTAAGREIVRDRVVEQGFGGASQVRDVLADQLCEDRAPGLVLVDGAEVVGLGAGLGVDAQELGEKIVDEAVTFYSDPTHPELPAAPWSGDGQAQEKLKWIDKGVVKNLAYSKSRLVLLIQLPLG